jgi:hypothetical protein
VDVVKYGNFCDVQNRGDLFLDSSRVLLEFQICINFKGKSEGGERGELLVKHLNFYSCCFTEILFIFAMSMNVER